LLNQLFSREQLFPKLLSDYFPKKEKVEKNIFISMREFFHLIAYSTNKTQERVKLNLTLQDSLFAG